jgi:hypothetical protein
VSAEGKTPFDTQVLYVYVPRRFRNPATLLSDRAILEKDVNPVMLPFSLSKADPDVFYDQMTLHQQFLDTHKNIQIHDVSMAHLNHTEEVIDGKPSTLRDLLYSNPKITRIYRFEKEAKLNLSVSASEYFGVTKWLDNVLAQFTEYHPRRVYGSPVVRFAADTSSVTSDAKSKYSSRFKVTSGTAYDPTSSSAIKSRRNAWVSGPPLELFFEAGKGTSLQDDDFPPLSGYDGQSVEDSNSAGYSGPGGYGVPSATGKSAKSSITPGTEPSTTMTLHLEEMVRAAVAATTAKLAEEFKELKAENARIKEDFRTLQETLSTLPNQITDSTTKALTGPTSPITDLQQDVLGIRASMEAFMSSIQEAIHHRGPITAQLGPQNYGDQGAPLASPPRKLPRSTEFSADSPMAVEAESGIGDHQ